ncbi:MAG: helix-turn-helix transcriptional regulator [Chloroflexota bacterium]
MTRLSFTDLLNLLIDNIPDEEGDKYSLAEISRQTGISVNQLGHYRRGTHSNPTLENVVTLLDLFEMPLAYLDCTNKVDAMKMITEHHTQGVAEDTSSEFPSVRFRNPEGLNISDRALHQVTELLQWVFAREEAIKKGEDEPPLPDFSQS